MEISIKKEYLENAIKQAGNFLPRKGTKANFLHLAWLTATGNEFKIQIFDGGNEFTSKIPSNILEEGEIGVSCRELQNILKTLPKGNIILSNNLETNLLELSQNQFKYTLALADTSWKQSFQDFPPETQGEIDGKRLKELLNKVKFPCDDNFNKVRIAPLEAGNFTELCGMNKHTHTRQITRSIGIKEDILINKDGVDKLTKWLNKGKAEIAQTNTDLFIKQMDQFMKLPRQRDSWIDYSEIYSNFYNEESLKVDKEKLLNSLERSKAVITETQRCCLLNLEENQISLEAGGDPNKLKENIPADCNSNIGMIKFPIPAFTLAIKQFNSDTITVYLTWENGPALFKERNYDIILMPVEMDNSEREDYY